MTPLTHRTAFSRFALHALLLCALQGYMQTAQAQVLPLDRDTVKAIFASSPAFTIYKNNYFITGVPLDKPVSAENSDAKFQVSFKQRLFNKPILGSYIHLVYTQKSFWDIYKSSSPFRETNYNPGLMVVRPLYKNNRLKGAMAFSFEHESNGRDSIYSRSWNYLAFAYSKVVSERLICGLKVWLPFINPTEGNPDLIDYIGYGEAELHWTIKKKLLFLDFVGRKGAANDLRGNMQVDISYKAWKAGNQYLMLQWFYGNSESLVNYAEKQNMLRIGIMFKPQYYRFY
ncbi:MAG TPA: phospholipase A [Phnomibacter sp.]|nr:phospholipase A [Phnomibacter sp.]